MFGCYRKGDANDPDTYVQAIAGVLADYDTEIIRKVTDPRYGLPRRLQWMPTVFEVADECEAEQSRAARIAEMSQLRPLPKLPPAPRLPGYRANLLFKPDFHLYAAFVERAKTADPKDWKWDEQGRGIWVGLSWLEAPVAKLKPMSLTDEDLRRLYPPREEQPAA